MKLPIHIVLAAALLPVWASAVFTADLSKGEVSIKLESTPDKVTPASDVMLTFTVEAPSALKVTLPDLQNRFSGFSQAEDFATDPIEANGKTRQTYRWRLMPEPGAERYRLAPFAVTVADTRVVPAKTESFATAPVVFPGEGERPAVTGKPEVDVKPEWIPPTAKAVTLWGLAVLAGLAAIAAIIWGLTRITVKVKEFRMSPVDRAMAELQRLLNRNLPQHGLYKEFYIELTQVVRRYIERRHGIRAPEQTTEEFLLAAARHPSFTPEVLSSLRHFLESADLVKFAGQEASVSTADQATASAKAYLTEDNAQPEQKELK